MERRRILRARAVAALAVLLLGFGADAIAAPATGGAVAQRAAVVEKSKDPVSQPARIAAAIRSALDDFNRRFPGILRIDLSAPLVPIEQGNQVLITFRKVRLMAFESGNGLALGDIVLAITPRPGGYYDFTTKLPPLIEVLDDGRNVVGTITFGSHSISGTWWADHGIMTALDGALRGIRIRAFSATRGKAGASIDSIVVKSRTTRKASGLWDATFDFRVSDLQTDPTPHGKRLEIGGIRFIGRSDDFDSDNYRKLGDMLDLDPATGRVKIDPVKAARIADTLETLNFGSSTVELSALRIRYSERDRTLFSLDNASWRFGFDGTKALGTLKLALGVEKLEVADTYMPELMPRRVVLDMSFDRMPLRKMLVAVFRVLATRRPGDHEDRPPLDTATFQGLMFEARPTLTLKDLVVETTSAKFASSGGVTFDATAALMVFGGFNATIAGLSDLMLAVAAYARKNETALKAYSMLETLKEYGEPDVAADGTDPVYKYRIELHRDGRITVNGIPLIPGRKSRDPGRK